MSEYRNQNERNHRRNDRGGSRRSESERHSNSRNPYGESSRGDRMRDGRGIHGSRNASTARASSVRNAPASRSTSAIRKDIRTAETQRRETSSHPYERDRRPAETHLRSPRDSRRIPENEYARTRTRSQYADVAHRAGNPGERSRASSPSRRNASSSNGTSAPRRSGEQRSEQIRAERRDDLNSRKRRSIKNQQDARRRPTRESIANGASEEIPANNAAGKQSSAAKAPLAAISSLGSSVLAKAMEAKRKASEKAAQRKEAEELEAIESEPQAATTEAIETESQATAGSASETTKKEPGRKASEASSAEPSLNQAKIKSAARWRGYALKGFSGILTAGFVLGLAFFLRPSVSEVENRELTKFPSFSVSDFLSGTFTEGVSTWYADTYPFRDQLIALNQWIKGLYGFESSTQMYGNSIQGDEIPSEKAKTEKAEKKDPVAPETYDSWNLEEDIQGQIMQGLYVEDGSVYATYGFTQEAADDYVNAVNSAADKLDGVTQVHSILIPNNSGILLDKNELAALGGSNQEQAIEYYYNSYSDKVKTVPTMDPLKMHKDDYIFFRTDHHWTALGAYYVYQRWCEEMGIEAHPIEDFEEQDFSPFLGSYYSQLQLDSLAANPDTVQAWVPMGTNDLTYTDVDGNKVEWNVIRDVSEWDQGTKYNCFVGGDQPWAVVHNPEITDGSSCVIVKESYGNAFAPWLVDHYEYVYIADFRYTNTNVVDFCKEHEVKDLILLNNISIIGSVDVAGKIASIL